MKRKVIYSLSFIICALIATTLVLKARTELGVPSDHLPTCFAYSEKDSEELRALDSKLFMSSSSLQKWDQITSKYVFRNRFSFNDSLRLYTYLYNAQRDAAFLSYNTHDSFIGSLDPISEGILRIFLSDYSRPNDYVADEYSEKLAEVILPKYRQRIEREDRLSLEYKVPASYMQRKETAYQVGALVAKWIPWVTKPEVAYWPPAPPSSKDPEWTKQISAIKRAQKTVDKEKRTAIIFWAGLSGPDSGDWRKIANDYIFENEIPFAKAVLARSMLMIATYDATIIYFSSKYSYIVIRPQVRDPSVSYLIDCPNHPSYPSGHSTGSTASAVVLSHYFPENAKEWNRLAEEAGLSRIWAGIHYPLDHEAGQEVGKKVGQAVLEEGESLTNP